HTHTHTHTLLHPTDADPHSYVPEDMAFEEADLWDECSADAADYTPVDFSTDVLRHSKVKLTWDSEDPLRTKYTRLNTQKLAQEELDQLDFARFIAPPSVPTRRRRTRSGRPRAGASCAPSSASMPAPQRPSTSTRSSRSPSSPASSTGPRPRLPPSPD
ncbi:hypothetical protein PTTG_11570, partial [Puccinia triticina 1-1 BBBD Race 1]